MIPQNAKYWWVPKYAKAFQMHLLILSLYGEDCKLVPYNQGVVIYVIFGFFSYQMHCTFNKVHYNMQF